MHVIWPAANQSIEGRQRVIHLTIGWAEWHWFNWQFNSSPLFFSVRLWSFLASFNSCRTAIVIRILIVLERLISQIVIIPERLIDLERLIILDKVICAARGVLRHSDREECVMEWGGITISRWILTKGFKWCGRRKTRVSRWGSRWQLLPFFSHNASLSSRVLALDFGSCGGPPMAVEETNIY